MTRLEFFPQAVNVKLVSPQTYPAIVVSHSAYIVI